MNRATAEAVEAFRSVKCAEWALEQSEKELAEAMSHPDLDLSEYANVTFAIEEAIAEVDKHADAYADSTVRQRRMVALQTGRE